MKFFHNLTFWLFVIEDTDIYQMLLVLEKNTWRSVLQCNCIVHAIFNRVP